MPRNDVELARELHKSFPNAVCSGQNCWSTALENGCSHQCRISIENGVLVLTTGPIHIIGSPQNVAAMNASLPCASRIVCTTRGLQLRTECALQNDSPLSTIWGAAILDFQAALDVAGGVLMPQTIQTLKYGPEIDAPAPYWNARENEDGSLSVPIIDRHALMRASAQTVTAEMTGRREYPYEVRSALAEYLLRATSQLRFVKACAAPDSISEWSAWLEASPQKCGMDEALAAVIAACRDCAPAVKALTELPLASRFHEIASIWRSEPAPISHERR